ncbi:XRE family transcriptional regulator [Pirellulales bacterium]|nr:XRE family transcriptional regulator [Pirellulales bacterium]
MHIAQQEGNATPMRMSLAAKLKLARQGVGLSTRKVADRLPTCFTLSHATLANYEKGRSAPPIDILTALAAIYERPINWFLEPGTPLTNIRYRNLPSRVRAGDRHKFEAEVQRWLEAYVAIEGRLGVCLEGEFADFRAADKQTSAELAQEVRRMLSLGASDTIPSVTNVLDEFGIRTIEHVTDLRIDGLAAKFGAESAVVLNPAVSNDRSRLNAAHELAHVIFGDCDRDVTESKAAENRAFDFASIFLLPNAKLKEAFVGQSMVRLVQFKEIYGISLAAMVYRAEKLRYISKATAKKLWIEFSRRGWRVEEPGTVRPDRATRFEQLLDSAIFEKRISLREAAALAGVRPEEIRQRIDSAMGLNASATDDDEPSVLQITTE